MYRTLREFLHQNKRIAVVGTGAVGSAIRNSLDQFGDQLSVDYFNSKNIDQAFDKYYDLLIYAGVRAFKGSANNDPAADELHILKAADTFARIGAFKKVLISTIDAALENEYQSAYGRNRRKLEDEVMKLTPNCQILRLPALFGSTVKKNAWHDMIIGPENVKLTPQLQDELFKENAESDLEINIVSRVTDDSRFVWFDLDTILEAICELCSSLDELRMYVSYDRDYPNGIFLSHGELKSVLNCSHVGESKKAAKIDYSSTFDKQRLAFIKSSRPINDKFWIMVVE